MSKTRLEQAILRIREPRSYGILAEMRTDAFHLTSTLSGFR